VRLADKLSLPVLVAPSPSRCPFPTRWGDEHAICAYRHRGGRAQRRFDAEAGSVLLDS
jgi:hypothetical protein